MSKPPKTKVIEPSSPSGLPGWPIEKVSKEELAQRYPDQVMSDEKALKLHCPSCKAQLSLEVPVRFTAMDVSGNDAAVAEIVKAARAKLDAEPYASGTPYDPRAEAATRALEAALKPFEG